MLAVLTWLSFLGSRPGRAVPVASAKECWRIATNSEFVVEEYVNVCTEEEDNFDGSGGGGHGEPSCRAGGRTGCQPMDAFADCVCATQTIRHFCPLYANVSSLDCCDFEDVTPCLSRLTESDEVTMREDVSCQWDNMTHPPMPTFTGCSNTTTCDGVILETIEDRVVARVTEILKNNGCDTITGETMEDIFEWFKETVYPAMREGYRQLAERCERLDDPCPTTTTIAQMTTAPEEKVKDSTTMKEVRPGGGPGNINGATSTNTMGVWAPATAILAMMHLVITKFMQAAAQ